MTLSKPDTAARTSTSSRKVFWLAMTGTALEYYDFFIYATASALVFGVLYFPSEDPMTGTLLSFATFGVGFLARPLGGVIFGHFGDRLGRKLALRITLIMMGVATVAIGLLPTYDSIGVLAPVGLVLLRIVQGLAAGGEWGGAALFGIESAPHGKRGLFGSFTTIGIGVGGLIAALVFTLVARTTGDALLTWGWRIPFFVGGLIAIVGIAARSRMEDTSDFKRSRTEGATPKLPILQVFSSHGRTVAMTFGVSFGVNTLNFVAFTWMLSYVAKLGYGRTESLLGQAVYALVFVVTAAGFAIISDRRGRRPVIVGGAIVCAAFFFVGFPLVGLGNIGSLLAFFGLIGLLSSALLGPLPAFLGEQFPVEIRYSAMSTGYQVGAAVGGGTAPIIATAFIASGGGWPTVAAYVAATLVVTAVCTLLLPEKAHVRTAEL
nr:MFS transporter [Rhodococcus sp. (in: high G+C Gram-positive bacteria)]